MLRHLGAPIFSFSHMFGDDKSAFDSIIAPNGKIHKHHAALSFHRVRESAASGIVACQFVDGKRNPEDALNKHWVHDCIYPTLKPIIFRPGGTVECFDDGKLE